MSLTTEPIKGILAISNLKPTVALSRLVIEAESSAMNSAAFCGVFYKRCAHGLAIQSGVPAIEFRPLTIEVLSNPFMTRTRQGRSN
jgi:hypothetical protein